MDVVTTVNDRTYYLDVSITQIITPDHCRQNSRAMQDANAAHEREQQKRKRYGNHLNLVPFVLEPGGRFGPSAQQWVSDIIKYDDHTHINATSELRYACSTLLQRSNAEALHTATD